MGHIWHQLSLHLLLPRTHAHSWHRLLWDEGQNEVHCDWPVPFRKDNEDLCLGQVCGRGEPQSEKMQERRARLQVQEKNRGVFHEEDQEEEEQEDQDGYLDMTTA